LQSQNPFLKSTPGPSHTPQSSFLAGPPQTPLQSVFYLKQLQYPKSKRIPNPLQTPQESSHIPVPQTPKQSTTSP